MSIVCPCEANAIPLSKTSSVTGLHDGFISTVALLFPLYGIEIDQAGTGEAVMQKLTLGIEIGQCGPSDEVERWDEHQCPAFGLCQPGQCQPGQTPKPAQCEARQCASVAQGRAILIEYADTPGLHC